MCKYTVHWCVYGLMSMKYGEWSIESVALSMEDGVGMNDMAYSWYLPLVLQDGVQSLGP